MTKQLQGNVKKHAYVGVDGCGALSLRVTDELL